MILRCPLDIQMDSKVDRDTKIVFGIEDWARGKIGEQLPCGLYINPCD